MACPENGAAPANRLVSWNGTGYEYVKSGNRTKIGARTLIYEGLGRVRSAGSGAVFAYSGIGNDVSSDGTVLTAAVPVTIPSVRNRMRRHVVWFGRTCIPMSLPNSPRPAPP